MMPPDFGTERKAMHVSRALLPALAAALLVTSCANPTATFKHIAYGDPAAPYLGMSKADIIACAGQPRSRYPGTANVETLTYHYNGAGPVPGEAPKSDKKDKKDQPDEKKQAGFLGGVKKDAKDWTCTASLVFENDHLIRVNFASKDVESPYAYQSGKSPEQRAKNLEKGPQEQKTCTFSLPNCAR
jgi:hypothetical protein